MTRPELTDDDLIVAVAPLLRVLSEQEPDRRVEHLAAYAERRAGEIRRGTAAVRGGADG